MSKVKYSIGVGLISLVAIGMLIYASVNMTNSSSIGKNEGYSLYLLLDNAAGLSKGSSILSAGIKVGTIEKISLHFDKARIDLRILNEVAVYEDATVSLASLGLLGDKYLKLILGSPNKPYLKNGDRILDVIDVIGVDESFNSARKALDAVSKLVDRLDSILGDQYEQINQIIGNINEISKGISTKINNFDESKLEDVMDNVNDALLAINKVIEQNEGNINKTTDKLPNVTENLEKATDKLDQILDGVNKSLQNDSPVKKLISDEYLGQKLDNAITGMSDFFGGVGKLKIDLGFKFEYLGNANKGYINLFYIPTRERFFILNLVTDSRGFMREEISQTAKTVNNNTTTERVVTEKQNTISFSAQLAQRYYDSVFRVGLFENNVGAGFDQYFGKNDRLRTTFEVFNFNRQRNNPHLRLFADLKLLGNIYISGGLDDFINTQPGRRKGFIGIGLNFQEDNLQTLTSAISLVR